MSHAFPPMWPSGKAPSEAKEAQLLNVPVKRTVVGTGSLRGKFRRRTTVLGLTVSSVSVLPAKREINSDAKLHTSRFGPSKQCCKADVCVTTSAGLLAFAAGSCTSKGNDNDGCAQNQSGVSRC